MSTLQGKFIKDTYNGVLHSDGELTTTKSDIYDGKGNKSSLSIGKSGSGAEISGELTVGDVVYPDAAGNVGDIVFQKTATDIGFTTRIAASNLPILNPSPADTYSNIKSITVNSNGLITDVEENSGGGLIITSTTYVSNAANTINGGSVALIKDTWTKVDLPDTVPSNALAAIIYIQPTTVLFAQATGLGFNTKVVSSPDKSSEYPAIFMQGGNFDDRFGVDPYGSGAQFYTPIGGTSSKFFWLKATGTDTTTDTWDLHLIAYQQ